MSLEEVIALHDKLIAWHYDKGRSSKKPGRYKRALSKGEELSTPEEVSTPE